MHSTSGVCVCCLASGGTNLYGMMMYGCTKQPKLTAIIQSRRLTLFGHIMRMDNNADAKRILLASPPADWRRQLGRPRITWLSTIQQDLKHHHLTLPEAADLAQNRPLWRMMSTYGATQSWVACKKRRRLWHTQFMGHPLLVQTNVTRLARGTHAQRLCVRYIQISDQKRLQRLCSVRRQYLLLLTFC